MHISEISPTEYASAFGQTGHVFNSVAFSELNRSKASALHYLAFCDTKTRFGLILGERGDGLYSPFSAPFGGFEQNGRQRLEKMEEAVIELKAYAAGGKARPGKAVHITLPPPIYGGSEPAKWANVMQRHGTLEHIDLNYHFDLTQTTRYEDVAERNARKNLHRALREDFGFTRLDSTSGDDIERAYRIIKANREEHGYPLRMSLQAVKDTARTLHADFFAMTLKGKDVAAAQVFHVAKDVAQVIYWGDLHAYSHLRTMNRLAYEMFSYYHGQGLRILDIGPSTVNGVPNHGLCSFKESIGCLATPKFSFTI